MLIGEWYILRSDGNFIIRLPTLAAEAVEHLFVSEGGGVEK